MHVSTLLTNLYIFFFINFSAKSSKGRGRPKGSTKKAGKKAGKAKKAVKRAGKK